MAKVKCPFCQKTFDREKEPFVKIGARRYAHLACANQQGNAQYIQEQQDKDDFFNLVKTIYGNKYNYLMINTQAENFIKQYEYTWSGMKACLYWFYIINHGSLEEGHGGIGIIPYIYEQVRDYYMELYKTKERNKKKELRAPVVEFNIQPPKTWNHPPHLLNLDQE